MLVAEQHVRAHACMHVHAKSPDGALLHCRCHESARCPLATVTVYYRSPSYNFSRVAMTFIVAWIYGTTYYQVSRDYWVMVREGSPEVLLLWRGLMEVPVVWGVERPVPAYSAHAGCVKWYHAVKGAMVCSGMHVLSQGLKRRLAPAQNTLQVGEMPDPANIASVQNVLGILYSSTNFLGMTNLMAVMPVMGAERIVYYVSATAASWLSCQLPARLLDCLLLVVGCGMLDLQS